MTAVTFIREAAKSGVWVGLNGGNLVARGAAKPLDELFARLKPDKAEIVARQAASSVKNNWRP
jgi:hypothetical protein